MVVLRLDTLEERHGERVLSSEFCEFYEWMTDDETDEV